MSLMAANEESDSSAILNGFWVTLFFINHKPAKRPALNRQAQENINQNTSTQWKKTIIQ